ncbi:hypothetical protein [Desertivibrio insolitus]|uniref:hypothetical protein n=1 Tax=Herbiconiux sp. SYSU D00978 TaxID=2812562 RepID=UPI001F60F4B3|nr:hypothetical protein [Herbiconiux sp. SYSU D00978]
MSEQSASAASVAADPGVERAGRRWPWWVRVAAVYAASRVVTTALMLAFAAQQPANQYSGASPDYVTFANYWDARWYSVIAFGLYPSELPRTTDGHVEENAWAFMPAYPLLVRGLVAVTGLPFATLAVATSVLFGLGFALAAYRLFALRLPEGSALFAVAVVLAAPTSPVLQVGYAESMQLFLLAVALYLLLTRRYLLLAAVVPVLALTRPTGLALALALGLHVGWRWWREREGFPARERRHALVATAVAVLSGFAWMAVAGLATGELWAYPDTELAWRSDYIGRVDLVPFEGFVLGMLWWFGPVGVPLLVALLALGVVVLLLPWTRRLGPDLRLWVGSYGLYLLAVFFPQSSLWRLLMPLFPLAGALAVPRHPLYRGALLVAGVAGQAVWLHLCWWIDGVDWTPP